MKYMILAGEASGDLHASHLISSLRRVDTDASFVFMGGDKMAAASGTEPVIHIRDMAYMGFSEVLRHLPQISRNLNTAKAVLSESRPDALILVDYPSFNLKVAKSAKKLGIPVFYYISPKVWAWKEHRVGDIKRLVDKMFVIFPFEVDFYRERHDYAVEYVGNPTLTEVDDILSRCVPRADFLAENKLRERPIVALLPGSRASEIRNNLAVMTAALERFPQYRGVIAGAPDIPESQYRLYTDLPVVRDRTIELLSHSVAALVTSGTATLETAVAGTPQVACYRSNGSRFAYEVMKRILKVPFVTLPNLIIGRQAIPELLLHNCTPDNIAESLTPLLRDTETRRTMLEDYAEIRRILTTPLSPPDTTAKAIVSHLKNTHSPE